MSRIADLKMTSSLSLSWRRAIISLVILLLLAGAGVFVLIKTGKLDSLPISAVPNYVPNAERGRLTYIIGGCNDCHRGTDGAALPSGGHALKTPIGVLYAPNLTPDAETGLGRWTDIDFLNAMTQGIAPDGSHYVPAFPYTSYRNMTFEDILDLRAYLATLSPVKRNDENRGVPLEPLLRPLIGVWKLLAFDGLVFVSDPTRSAQWNRGAYLVRGPGHCGECHTPRNLFMISDNSRFLAGGSHPNNPKVRVRSLRGLVKRGRYPNADKLARALRWGFGDLSSGDMGDVQENIAQLPREDIRAIAEYLVSLD
jgi:mono/diheme cytochrome c family protein